MYIKYDPKSFDVLGVFNTDRGSVFTWHYYFGAICGQILGIVTLDTVDTPASAASQAMVVLLPAGRDNSGEHKTRTKPGAVTTLPSLPTHPVASFHLYCQAKSNKILNNRTRRFKKVLSQGLNPL